MLIAGSFTDYTKTIGAVSLGLAIVFIGIGSIAGNVFVDGNQTRANLATESSDDRQRRSRLLLHTGVISVPLFIAGGILLSI